MGGLTDSKSLTLKENRIVHLLSEEQKFKKWIELEKDVARIQAELGYIPMEAAEAIENEVSFDNFSQESYEKHLSKIGHGFYSFVETVLEGTSDLTKKYFHYGITTQNIQQSSQMLILREVNNEFMVIIKDILKNLSRLAENHHDDLMPARTHSKHAMPTTFGYVVASWIEELIPGINLFKQGADAVNEVMFGGAVGCFNSLGEIGFKMQEKIAEKHKARSMPIPSRNIQLPKVSYISSLIVISNVFHKIAEAVYNNSVEELSEFTEYSSPTQIGSSTMPHKINPKLSKGIIGNAMKLNDTLNSSLYSNVKPYESNSASYMVLDNNVNEAIGYFYEILIRMRDLSRLIEFNKERAYQHIIDNEGLDNSEYVMMKLSDELGKYKAHEIVHEVAMEYQKKSQLTYTEALMANEYISENYSTDVIEEWLKPENYMGLASKLALNTVKRTQDYLSNEMS